MANTIEIVVTAKDMATGEMAKINRALKNFAQSYYGLRQMATDIYGVGKAIYDFAKEAARLADVRESFKYMAEQAGLSAGEVMEAMNRAAKGTMDSHQMMLMANRIMASDFGASAEDIGTAIEISRLKAKQFGISVDEAFTRIVLGAQRHSKVILDDLNILLDETEAQEMYARILGKTTDELTNTEKRAAYWNAILSEGRKELKKYGDVTSKQDPFNRLERSLKQLGAVVGTALQISGVLEPLASAAEAAAKGIALLTLGLTTTKAMMKDGDIADDIALLGHNMIGDIKPAQDLAGTLEKFSTVLTITTGRDGGLGQAARLLGILSGRAEDTNEVMGEWAEATDAGREAMKKVLEAMDIFIDENDDAENAQKDLAKAELAAAEAAEKERKTFQGMVGEMADLSARMRDEQIEIANDYAKRREDIVETHSKRLLDIQKRMGEATAEAEQAQLEETQNYEKQRSEIMAAAQAEREREQADHLRRMAEAEQEYRDSVHDAEQDFQDKLSDMAWEHNRRRAEMLRKIQEEQERLVDKFARDQQQLEDKYAKDRDKTEDKYGKQRADVVDEYNNIIVNLNEEHDAQLIAAMEAERDEKLALIEDAQQKELAVIEEARQAELAELERQKQEELTRLQAEQAERLALFEQEYQHRLQVERREHDQKMERMDRDHGQAMEKLRAQHEERMNQIRQATAERLAELDESHAEELQKIEEQKTKRLATLAEQRAEEQQNYSERLADLDEWRAEELADIAEHGEKLTKQWQETWNELSKEHQRFLSEWMTREAEAFGGAVPTPVATYQGTAATYYGMQHGGMGVVRKPTLFLAGERGPEAFAFQPLRNLNSPAESGGQTFNVTINLGPGGGYEQGQAAARGFRDELRARGLT